jgi:hypothetical protein
MKPLSILFVASIAYGLGKSDWRVRPRLALATVLLAGVLHGVLRVGLPHEAIERFASSASLSILLMLVAALETAGIWLPVLLVPWGETRTRAAAAAYVIAAATLGALVYYQPFEIIIVNGEALGPTHPQYGLALIFSLVIAAVPFACGIAIRLRQGKHGQRNAPLQPTNGAVRNA